MQNAHFNHAVSKIHTVDTQGSDVLIRVGSQHFVVSHVDKGDWRVFPVTSFPHTGYVTKRKYPFVKGKIVLARSSSWEGIREKLLSKNNGFYLH